MKIAIILLITLSSCSIFKYTNRQKRTNNILDCTTNFSEDEVDVLKAYYVCKDLYQRRIR